MEYRTSMKVRFAHCDPAGIVFYPRYFEMLNSVVEDWFAEELGADFASLHLDRHLGVPTVRLETEFSAPSRLGDILDAALSVQKVGTSSCAVRVVFASGGEQRLAVSLVLVAIDMRTGKSQPWPADLREALAAAGAPA
ncbi:acyl-CoA thioesterase [Sphingomonas hengshuiensis]|uniref:Thioesterase n=1 Tax=Sphingomonas hengshuiensis TaxID=1609977 RepID=A0A7U5CUN6_9SPHN|nr:thioesterase family protein [Sphingomonas hengshuiensis]AJP70799.1 thioesterase [Sphingomonas hengshuiensis]